MNNQKSYEIVVKGKIVLKNIPTIEDYTKETKQRIDEIWKIECEKRNGNLFNDKVLSFIEITEKLEYSEVKGKFVDYKSALADRVEPSLGLQIYQIGVSGLVVIKEKNDDYVLFATRDSKNTEYPNYLELVPSGNMDQSVLNDNGNIDYKSKIVQEFTEETGMDENSIENITTICFVKDLYNRVFDVCCLIEIMTNKTALEEGFKKVSEYQKPLLIPTSNLLNFVEKNYNKIVPTSLGIIDCFTQQID